MNAHMRENDLAQPLVCDLTGSGETPGDRLEDYRRLFAAGLLDRRRTGHRIRFRFRADAVDEEQVRDLAAREMACCPFFDIQVQRVGDELWWDTAVEDPQAGPFLDEFYLLPEHVLDVGGLPARMRERGLLVVADACGQEGKLDHS